MQLAAHLRVAPANNSKQFLGSCRHNATVAARAGRVDLDQVIAPPSPDRKNRVDVAEGNNRWTDLRANPTG